LSNLEKKVRQLETDLLIKNNSPIKRSHAAPVEQHLLETDSKGMVGRNKARIGTRGSLSTSTILQAINEEAKSSAHEIAEKFLRMFQNPIEHYDYLHSQEFVDDLTLVCQAVSDILEEEPRCVFLQSPVYIFGDIHGGDTLVWPYCV
jgi:hypothetical protein